MTKRPDILTTCAHAAFPMTAGLLASRMVPGTLSLAVRIGRAVSTARVSGQDAAAAAAQAMDARIMFIGRVTDREWVDEDGYQIGTMMIEGGGDYTGQTARIWLRTRASGGRRRRVGDPMNTDPADF